MENVATRFALNLREGLIEISGSETFVEKHMASLSEHIDALLSGPPAGMGAPTPKASGGSSTDDTPVGDDGNGRANGATENPYPNVFDLTRGADAIEIMAAVPGDTTKARAINVAYLYMLGKKLLGFHQVPSTEIRNECDRLGCLDGGNFSKTMEDIKANLMQRGTPRNRAYQLSPRGETAAKEIAQQLEDAVA